MSRRFRWGRESASTLGPRFTAAPTGTAARGGLRSRRTDPYFGPVVREAYLAELYRLEKNPAANAERLAQTRRKLALLGAPAPKPQEPQAQG